MQLYDARGRPAGTAPRSRVRAENLRHGATGVVVRDRMGRIYVHRRTRSKDVYPGLYDFAAGGVITGGEDPAESARREVAEELGVTGATIRGLGVGQYGDDHARYLSFQYEVEYDGPIRHQPEEVAWGAWMTLEELSARLQDQAPDFVPDSRALLGAWLRERLADKVVVHHGWDSRAELVEGRWVDRFPRRPDVGGGLLAETVVMSRLAPLLPLAVPVPQVIVEDPLRVRHRLVEGEPLGAAASRADGARLGEFLRSLHSVPDAVRSGARGAEASRRVLDGVLERFGRDVLPRLPERLQDAGADLLERVRAAPHECLVHGDLGPRHILCTEGVSGVIDWTDMHIGDPAVDLAWVLHGGGSELADGVSAAYGPSREVRERALDWYRLGPWHEVVRGVDGSHPGRVAAGLAGIIERL